MTPTSRFVRLSLLLCLLSLLSTSLFAAGDVVISQVYGGGGNAGATLKNDFIEIFNRSGNPVNITGWSVQYASSAGTTWQRTILSGTLQPGQYYLIQQSQGAGGTVTLPAPDATGSIAMSATAGKVALMKDSTLLAGASPIGNPMLSDLVGFGGANAFEGAGGTPALSNTTAALRRTNGCTDTDNNAADFLTGAPAPRNSASPLNPCIGPTPPQGAAGINPSSAYSGQAVLIAVTVTPGANPTSSGLAVTANLSSIGDGPAQQLFDDGANGDAFAADLTFSFSYVLPAGVSLGVKTIPVSVTDAQGRTGTSAASLTVVSPPPPALAINVIQGSASTSPYAGTVVSTTGIVTARKSNGFFIQTPDGGVDSDSNTSEGIFVFTSSSPSTSLVQAGNLVSVTGTVVEFVPSADPSSPPLTEIGGGPSITLLSSGNPLPAAVTLTGAHASPTGSIEQLEKYEGMRVQVPSLTVIAPTDGNTSEASATATSNGIFYGVITGTARPFREPGVEVPDPLPAGSPAGVPRFDANPERLRVDTRGQAGSVVLDVTANAVVTNLTGPLDYGFRTYTILQDPPAVSPAPAVAGMMTVVPAPEPAADELTIASFNMQRFFDTVDDAGVSDVKLTAAAFERRLNKASLSIRDVLRSPDIIGMQEVENLSTLQAIAARVNADAVSAGAADPQYQAHLYEGADVGGIDVGFLVKASTVTVLDIVQEAVGSFVQPDGATAQLNDRPSLTMRVRVSRPKADPLELTVQVNHLRSLNDIDDPGAGARVRAKRRAQAEFLADIIQQRQADGEKIVSIGDFNAFQFSDGYVDVMGTVRGAPAPANEVVLASPDLVDPDLVDLALLLPASERYTYSFGGHAQQIDHIIASRNAASLVTRYAIARVNADFPEAYRGDGARPERLSDHDPAVAYLQLPPQDFVPPALFLPANITVEAQGAFGAVVTFVASGHDAATGPVAVTCDHLSGATFALGTTTVSCSAADRHDNTASGSFTITVEDTTAPTINIAAPSGTYTIGQAVNAAYACADLVGVIDCIGDAPNGGAVNTAAAGTHTFTVNARDAAGNSSFAASTYQVTYAVCVLFDQSKARKSGSTLPVKLQLCDEARNNYSSATRVVTATGLTLVSNAASFVVEDSGNANPDGNFRYDAALAGYIFNLSTKGLGAGTYALHFTVQGDPATHSVTFQVR